MNYTFVALVENKPGVLDRVASLFRRRNFNIESINAGTTENPDVTRMTIVVDCPNGEVDAHRIEANLYKLVNVVSVDDITSKPAVFRDLAMIKVAARPERRPEHEVHEDRERDADRRRHHESHRVVRVVVVDGRVGVRVRDRVVELGAGEMTIAPAEEEPSVVEIVDVLQSIRASRDPKDDKFLEAAVNGRPTDMLFRGYETMLRFALLLLDTKKDVASNLSRKGNTVFTLFDIQPVFLNKTNMTLDYFENKHLYFVKYINGVQSVVN